MSDLHLKTDQSLYQRDGDICIEIVTSALKHWMSGDEEIYMWQTGNSS